MRVRPLHLLTKCFQANRHNHDLSCPQSNALRTNVSIDSLALLKVLFSCLSFHGADYLFILRGETNATVCLRGNICSPERGNDTDRWWQHPRCIMENFTQERRTRDFVFAPLTRKQTNPGDHLASVAFCFLNKESQNHPFLFSKKELRRSSAAGHCSAHGSMQPIHTHTRCQEMADAIMTNDTHAAHRD